MIIQTKCKLDNAELFLKLHLRAKELETKKYYEETRDLEK